MNSASPEQTPPRKSSPPATATAPSLQDATTDPVRIPDYELVRRIGGGSYGEVWLARSNLGDHRALKVV
jgi:hypothetical protein